MGKRDSMLVEVCEDGDHGYFLSVLVGKTTVAAGFCSRAQDLVEMFEEVLANYIEAGEAA